MSICTICTYLSVNSLAKRLWDTHEYKEGHGLIINPSTMPMALGNMKLNVSAIQTLEGS